MELPAVESRLENTGGGQDVTLMHARDVHTISERLLREPGAVNRLVVREGAGGGRRRSC